MFDLDELRAWEEALKRLEAAAPDLIRGLYRAVTEVPDQVGDCIRSTDKAQREAEYA